MNGSTSCWLPLPLVRVSSFPYILFWFVCYMACFTACVFFWCVLMPIFRRLFLPKCLVLAMWFTDPSWTEHRYRASWLGQNEKLYACWHINLVILCCRHQQLPALLCPLNRSQTRVTQEKDFDCTVFKQWLLAYITSLLDAVLQDYVESELATIDKVRRKMQLRILPWSAATAHNMHLHGPGR